MAVSILNRLRVFLLLTAPVNLALVVVSPVVVMAHVDAGVISFGVRHRLMQSELVWTYEFNIIGWEPAPLVVEEPIPPTGVELGENLDDFTGVER